MSGHTCRCNLRDSESQLTIHFMSFERTVYNAISFLKFSFLVKKILFIYLYFYDPLFKGKENLPKMLDLSI